MAWQLVHESVRSCVGNTPLVRLSRLFPQEGLEVYAKLEYMNPGGSMKDRPARHMIEQGLREGKIHAGSHIIESTSGNLGIALATMAKLYGLEVTCVVDPNIAPTNLRMLRQMGAHVEMVLEKDVNGGYLLTRIAKVHQLLERIPDSYWINQYANEYNWRAYYEGTGGEIVNALDRLDLLIAGVSTSGSIMGTSRRLREKFPHLKVVAVDAVGSSLFGATQGIRRLPGIGASRVPELLRREEIDQVVYVNDWESAMGCRALLHHEGIFAGGSSGSVIAAIQKLVPTWEKGVSIVTLLPDRGERYLDMVYDDAWVEALEEKGAVVS
ncbi:2,3-diaminopropionate biosynthesis protein SbnA [Xylanibacillus composti]|nr:2,3-diaminopropionate biosynthesis protein SbnA [Xylanibacillus composti]